MIEANNFLSKRIQFWNDGGITKLHENVQTGTKKKKSILLDNVHMADALFVQAALTLELGQRVSQHSQLFALLLHVLLCHQAVVDG